MFARILTIFIIIFLILPVFIVIPISFSSAQYLTFPPPGFSLQWYESFFSDSEWVEAAIKSIQVGLLTTILSLVLGIMTSIGLVKGNFPGKQLLQNIFLMPLVVPTIIIAIAVYSFQSKTGLVGTTFGLVTAHTIMATPFVIVTVLASLKGMDPNLEYAAMSLGANPFLTFMKVTLNVIKPAIASSALFAFVTSFDEIVVTLFISGVSVTTLPKKMWDGVRTQVDPTIAAVSSIMIILIVVILISSQIYGEVRDNKMAKKLEETAG
ncbi:MAG: ABC transporter permease [Clostridia bacterium]|nr:ABC transporter permease [Clostridia bacterium]